MIFVWLGRLMERFTDWCGIPQLVDEDAEDDTAHNAEQNAIAAWWSDY